MINDHYTTKWSDVIGAACSTAPAGYEGGWIIGQVAGMEGAEEGALFWIIGIKPFSIGKDLSSLYL